MPLGNDGRYRAYCVGVPIARSSDSGVTIGVRSSHDSIGSSRNGLTLRCDGPLAHWTTRLVK